MSERKLCKLMNYLTMGLLRVSLMILMTAMVMIMMVYVCLYKIEHMIKLKHLQTCKTNKCTFCNTYIT